MVDYKYFKDFYIKITNETLSYNHHTWGSKIWEQELIEFFYDQIGEDYNIIDIGAQSGSFTLMSKFLPKTNWYSFEPDPLNFKLLKDNVEGNDIKNVNIYNKAIGKNIGESFLNICINHRGLNTMGNDLKRFSINDCDKIEIEVDTLDNIFENTRVDLIKIDTEGSEYDILLGAKNILKKYKPKILLEYHNQNLEQCGYNISILNELLKDLNYKISKKIDDNVFVEYI
jgi:FkbM family methyltransferase